MSGALGEPQAGRRACGLGLSRRPAKISEPRALARPGDKRATSGGGPRRQCAPNLGARIFVPLSRDPAPFPPYGSPVGT